MAPHAQRVVALKAQLLTSGRDGLSVRWLKICGYYCLSLGMHNAHYPTSDITLHCLLICIKLYACLYRVGRKRSFLLMLCWVKPKMSRSDLLAPQTDNCVNKIGLMFNRTHSGARHVWLNDAKRTCQVVFFHASHFLKLAFARGPRLSSSPIRLILVTS